MTAEVLGLLVGWCTAGLAPGAVSLYEAALAPPEPRGQHMAGEQQEQQGKVFFDLNGDGVPDYEQGWFWASAWKVLSWGVLTFAGSNTLAYKAVTAAERYRQAAEDAQPRG